MTKLKEAVGNFKLHDPVTFVSSVDTTWMESNRFAIRNQWWTEVTTKHFAYWYSHTKGIRQLIKYKTILFVLGYQITDMRGCNSWTFWFVRLRIGLGENQNVGHWTSVEIKRLKTRLEHDNGLNRHLGNYVSYIPTFKSVTNNQMTSAPVLDIKGPIR